MPARRGLGKEAVVTFPARPSLDLSFPEQEFENQIWIREIPGRNLKTKPGFVISRTGI
jgi:hypothetical protein